MTSLLDTWLIQLKLSGVDMTCSNTQDSYLDFERPITDDHIRKSAFHRAFCMKRISDPYYRDKSPEIIIEALTIPDLLKGLNSVDEFIDHMIDIMENGFAGSVSEQALEFAKNNSKEVRTELEELAD
jgi:hypothetical protein